MKKTTGIIDEGIVDRKYVVGGIMKTAALGAALLFTSFVPSLAANRCPETVVTRASLSRPLTSAEADYTFKDVSFLCDSLKTPVNAVAATGTLTFTGVVADGQKVTIGSRVYEFDTNSAITAGDVAVDVSGGATASDAVTALVSAITADVDAVVAAVDGAGDTVTLTALVKGGTTGNAIVTTETCTNASFGNATLTGGVDGTVGLEGEQVTDGEFVYWATDDNTVADTNWVGMPLPVSLDGDVSFDTIYTTENVGAEALSNLTATEKVEIHTTVLTFDAKSVTMTDATTAGSHGTAVVYTFPEGVVTVISASYNLAVARVGSALATNAALVCGLGSGSVATDNATLVGTGEADVINSTTGTFTSGAGTCGKHGALVLLDGHSSASTLNLNLAVPDAGSTGDDAVTVTGTATVVWAYSGDY